MGHGLSWSPAEELAVVKAAWKAGTSSITGAAMKTSQYTSRIYEEFLKLAPTDACTGDEGGANDPRRWRGRASGAVRQFFNKIKVACVRFHSFMVRVQCAELTGSATDQDRVRVAIFYIMEWGPFHVPTTL
jgi:hypothetical protein